MINTVVVRAPHGTARLPFDTWDTAFEVYTALDSALEGVPGVTLELYDDDGNQYDPPQGDTSLNETLANIARPPTPGFHKLGPAAQHRARGRAKAFYPFT